MTKTTLTLVIGILNALGHQDQSLLADEIWKTSIFIGLYTNTVEPCYKESGCKEPPAIWNLFQIPKLQPSMLILINNQI